MQTDFQGMFHPGMQFTPGINPMPGPQFPSMQPMSDTPFTGMPPMTTMPGMPTPELNKLENRINSLERDLKRMDDRLTRLEKSSIITSQRPEPLETPNLNKDLSSNPYHTSMQML
ncbi:MAG: hypothetical protein ACOXZR_02695 [Bacilli bacterium]|jgi:hypothetical protein